MVLTKYLVMSNFKIHKATASDAKAIADIYQDRPITGFSRLTHGTVDPSVFHSGLAEMFAESLGNSDEMLLVARDESHPERRVVSYISLARKTHVVPMTDEVCKKAYSIIRAEAALPTTFPLYRWVPITT